MFANSMAIAVKPLHHCVLYPELDVCFFYFTFMKYSLLRLFRWKNEIYWSYISSDRKQSFFSCNVAHISVAREKLKIVCSAGERMPFIVTNPHYEIISPKGKVGIGYAFVYAF